MKLQTKVLIMLFVVFGSLLVSISSYQYIRFRENKIYADENRRNQELVIEKVLQISKSRTEQLLNDNSGWDDMVDFVVKPDTSWAKDNVDFFVNSFKLSFVLAYNQDKKLVYKFGDETCLKDLKLPDETYINSNLAQAPFCHYFQYCGNNLVELFGATVVPASDSDARKTRPKGYLFVGKIWDQAYLQEHMEATGYEIRFCSSGELKNLKKEDQKVYFFRKIQDASGNDLATMVFSKDDSLSHDLAPLLKMTILVTLFIVLVTLAILFYFRKIILEPLSKVSLTLNTNDKNHIAPLNRRNDEFRELAILVQDFFAQKEALETTNQELHEINAAKDKLFSIVAHDLKNPVANIVVTSDLLIDFLKQKDLSTAQELADLLKEQSDQAFELVTTLFDWARSETGKISFNPRLLELNLVVEKVVDTLSTAAKMKEIVILPPDVAGIKVFADENMLSTVLRNLISNAIKYTKAGGTILISAQQKDEAIEVSVADTGVGMDQQTQEMIFRVDSNLSTYGTANEKGTGLGLIICKDFIKRHHGQIWVESKLGLGTKFTFSLPISSN